MTALRKPLYGVGINDWLAPTKVCGKPIWNYKVWQSMLERCYSEKFKAKRPTYLNTTCDVRWHSLVNFTEDIEKVFGFQNLELGWALDKDIVGGINHYSLETVCVVPLGLNNLLLTQESQRGEYPIGVSFDKSRGKFLASMKKEARTVNLGRFDSVQETQIAYKIAKIKHVRYIADKYRGRISEDVYHSLLKYTPQ